MAGWLAGGGRAAEELLKYRRENLSKGIGRIKEESGFDVLKGDRRALLGMKDD